MKKEIPLQILQIVEPILRKEMDYVTISKDENTYYLIKDRDEKSEFYFNIYKEIPENIQVVKQNPVLYVERLPLNGISLKENKKVIEYSALKGYLENWFELIHSYDQINSVHDGLGTGAFQKEFFDDFELVDEDADYAPFSSKQLFLLDEYLENLHTAVGAQKEEQYKKLVEEIQNDTIELREQLTVLTKNQVLKRVALIWAKLQKGGMKFAKEFLNEAKKHFFKSIIKKAIELSDKAGDVINIISDGVS